MQKQICMFFFIVRGLSNISTVTSGLSIAVITSPLLVRDHHVKMEKKVYTSMKDAKMITSTQIHKHKNNSLDIYVY